MALFHDYLAEPRLTDKMEMHWLGRKAVVLSLLHHLPLNSESLSNAGPIISSLMGDYVTTLSYHKRLRED